MNRQNCKGHDNVENDIVGVEVCTDPVMFELGKIRVPMCRLEAAKRFAENPYYFAGLKVVEVNLVELDSASTDLKIINSSEQPEIDATEPQNVIDLRPHLLPRLHAS